MGASLDGVLTVRTQQAPTAEGTILCVEREYKFMTRICDLFFGTYIRIGRMYTASISSQQVEM